MGSALPTSLRCGDPTSTISLSQMFAGWHTSCNLSAQGVFSMANTTYRSTANEAAEDLSNVASDVTERVGDAASRIQDRASEIGKKAVDQFTATTEYFREHD